jgi:hypothetical protein
LAIARPTQPFGVDVQPVACPVELSPLTDLLGLGFLRPADKCRLAAGHGELPEIVRPLDGAQGYHRVESVNVRCVTLGEEILPLLETAGRSLGAAPPRPVGGGLAMDPTAVGETRRSPPDFSGPPAFTYHYFLSTRATNAMEASSGAVRKRTARDRK